MIGMIGDEPAVQSDWVPNHPMFRDVVGTWHSGVGWFRLRPMYLPWRPDSGIGLMTTNQGNIGSLVH